MKKQLQSTIGLEPARLEQLRQVARAREMTASELIEAWIAFEAESEGWPRLPADYAVESTPGGIRVHLQPKDWPALTLTGIQAAFLAESLFRATDGWGQAGIGTIAHHGARPLSVRRRGRGIWLGVDAHSATLTRQIAMDLADALRLAATECALMARENGHVA